MIKLLNIYIVNNIGNQQFCYIDWIIVNLVSSNYLIVDNLST
jgi:hypothetical protein